MAQKRADEGSHDGEIARGLYTEENGILRPDGVGTQNDRMDAVRPDLGTIEFLEDEEGGAQPELAARLHFDGREVVGQGQDFGALRCRDDRVLGFCARD